MLGKVNWNPSTREIRIFGVILMVGFALVSALLIWRGKAIVARPLFSAACVVGLVSIAFPVVGGLFYRAWMGLGFCMGFVVSKIILTLIFFCIFTPVALVFRMMGRDALQRKRIARDSYWQEHPKVVSNDEFSHLF